MELGLELDSGKSFARNVDVEGDSGENSKRKWERYRERFYLLGEYINNHD